MMIAHMSTEVCVILTLRMITLGASTLMVQPSMTTFSITCPAVRAVMHPEGLSVIPAWTPVLVASG
jgi:hypothetical protein